ncbi:hypothetical protein [Rhizobium binxianense]
MSTWTLAFVVTPAIVVVLGYIAMRLHEWDLKRHRQQTKPGE